MAGDRKRKAKEYYKKSAKQFKPNDKQLAAGLKGFLCTCNNAEKQCIRETYNLLNEVADKIYGPENKNSVDSKDSDEAPELEADLDSELKSLRSEKGQIRRFHVADSGAKNVLFIKTQVASPALLVKTVIDSIKETKEQKTRYLLRILPVETTCKAVIDDIKKNLEPILDEHFEDAKNFHIQVHARNSNIKRDHILPELLSLFKLKFPHLTGTLIKPHKSLIIEIIKNIACLCVVEDYDENAKYNLLELAKKHSSLAVQEASATNSETASLKDIVTTTNEIVIQ